MQVHVVSNATEIKSDEFINKTAVVIDVLRATSTMVAALVSGCAGIIPMETVQDAKQAQGEGDLLGGERFCKKIAGFHFGNSPQEYTSSEIQGKRVIVTTTNGTRAIQKSLKASVILTGSMLNARACAKACLELKRDVVLVCAGTQDQFSLEDGLCAGFIIHELESLYDDHIQSDDMGTMLHWAYLQAQNDIEGALLACENGRTLSQLGFQEDVIYCAQANRYDAVPILHGQVLNLLDA